MWAAWGFVGAAPALRCINKAPENTPESIPAAAEARAYRTSLNDADDGRLTVHSSSTEPGAPEQPLGISSRTLRPKVLWISSHHAA